MEKPNYNDVPSKYVNLLVTSIDRYRKSITNTNGETFILDLERHLERDLNFHTKIENVMFLDNKLEFRVVLMDEYNIQRSLNYGINI